MNLKEFHYVQEVVLAADMNTTTPAVPRETITLIGDPAGSYRALIETPLGRHWFESILREDRLALVSSLYGPGPVIAWYLTIVAVLTSWIIHPQKRKHDTIDPDLTAVLIFPAVAVVDFVLQLRHFLDLGPVEYAKEQKWIFSSLPLVAMQAPFEVLELFIVISAIMFLLAINMRCPRRALAVVVVGLLCHAGECYMHFSELRNFENFPLDCEPWNMGPPRQKKDVIPPLATLMGTYVTGALPVLIVVTAGTALCFLWFPKASLWNPDLDLEGDHTGPLAHRDHERFTRTIGRRVSSWANKHTATCMGVLVLVYSVVMAVLPSRERWYEAWYSPNETLLEYLLRGMPCLATKFFPTTLYSITDLDQAITAAAGATVLVFSIGSACKSHYRLWKARRSTPSQDTVDIQLDELEQHSASNEIDGHTD